MASKKERREELFREMKDLKYKVGRYQAIIQDLVLRFDKKKEEFDALDYELAMENRTIIPSSQKTSKSREVRKFTLDEIKSIAVKLGVEITIKEEDEK